MEMQSEKIGAIAAALAKAQGEFASPEKGEKGNYGKYASLADIRKSVQPALSANGLAFVQIGDGNGSLITKLIHGESGEWIASSVPVFEGRGGGAQGYGSGLTYARRYGLAGITGVVADDDDDGQAASGDGARRADPKRNPRPGDRPATDADKPDPDAFARTVKMGIDAASTVEALNRFWAKQTNSLAKLEAASPLNHQWVQEAFTARMDILSQAPAKDDTDLTDVPF